MKITQEELIDVFTGTPRLDHPNRKSIPQPKKIEPKTYKIGYKLDENGNKVSFKFGTFHPNPAGCKGIRKDRISLE